MKKERRIALAVLIIMIVSLFSPYGVLFQTTVQAATGTIEEKPLVFNNIGITQKGSNRILRIQVAISSEEIINGLDLRFSIDTNRITPCNKNTGAASTLATMIMAQASYYAGNIYTKTYAADTGTFRLTAAENAGGFDIVGNGYIPGEIGDPEFDDAGNGFTAYYPIIDYYFKILDDSITEDNIPLDLFQLEGGIASLPTGIKISYKNENGVDVSKDINSIYGKGLQSDGKVLTGISIKTNPTKMTYEHGENLDLAGGELLLTYDDGTDEIISMLENGVTIESPTNGKADIKSIQVDLSYQGFTTSFTPTVTDPIEFLVFKSGLNQISYNQNDTIDWSKAELRATTKSGVITDIVVSSGISGGSITTDTSIADLTASNANITGQTIDGLDTGNQLITLGYGGKTVTTTILVNDTVSTVSIGKTLNKVVYRYGEILNLTGGMVTVYTSAGSTISIPMTDGSINVTGYQATTLGTQNLSVSFAGITATGNLSVRVDNYVDSITVNSPTKITYNYGESLDLTGGSIIEQMADGTKGNTILLTDSSIQVKGYQVTTIGNQNLTVTYTKNGASYTGTFQVTVNDIKDHLEIIAPTKTTYLYGENLDLAGGKVQVVMKSGSTLPATNLTSGMVTGYQAMTIGNQNLTVTYSGLTGNFNVAVQDTVKTITLNNPTSSQTYFYGSTLDFSGGEIILGYNGGTPNKTIPLSSATVTETATGNSINMSPLANEFGVNQTLLKNITLSYTQDGVTNNTSYDITIINNVQSIQVHTNPTKMIYNIKDSFDITGGEILITRSTGTPEVVDMANPNVVITGFDSSKEVSNQELTMTYTENAVSKTTTMKVDIVDSVKSIAISGIPKTVYQYGENLESLEIEVTKGSGTTKVPVDNSMISGYDKTILRRTNNYH